MGVVAECIRQLRLTYINQGRAPCFYEINNGLCDEFADELEATLMQQSLRGVQNLSSEALRCGAQGEPEGDERWDWALLEQHWGSPPPAGLTREDVDALPLGHHVWLSHDGRHYDAECPEGVESLFDLPIFRRGVVDALRLKGIDAPEVVTDDMAVTLAGEPVGHPTHIGRAVDFLREMGLVVEWCVGAEGFLPSLEIRQGQLYLDPRCPVSNLLHEAGHLAIMPERFRGLCDQDIDQAVQRMLEVLTTEGLPPDHPLLRAALQCGDPEATAWAWACGTVLGIPSHTIILDEEYNGTGEHIRFGLESRAYLGINGLQHAGFTRVRDVYTWLDVPTYPGMAFWLQGGPTLEPEPLFDTPSPY